MPWHKPWSAGTLSQRVQRPLRHNGDPYRGINVIALYLAATTSGFTSPFWMTYRRATELGGQVRKGEKSSPVVFASSVTKPNDDADEDAQSHEIHLMRGYPSRSRRLPGLSIKRRTT